MGICLLFLISSIYFITLFLKTVTLNSSSGSSSSIRKCGTPHISSSVILAVPIFMCLYTCIESAEIISPPTAFARLIDNDVFPTAVGPVKTIKSFIKSAPNRITQPESENEVFEYLIFPNCCQLYYTTNFSYSQSGVFVLYF